MRGSWSITCARSGGRSPSVRGAGIVPRLRALVEGGGAGDGSHTQTVVGKDAAAALGLGDAVLGVVAPARDGFLVPPERQRQHLGRIGDALESLDRDEAVHLLQIAAQRGSKRQIGVPT